eukprot:1233317-Pyramimonas_sp.AAC.1
MCSRPSSSSGPNKFAFKDPADTTAPRVLGTCRPLRRGREGRVAVDVDTHDVRTLIYYRGTHFSSAGETITTKRTYLRARSSVSYNVELSPEAYPYSRTRETEEPSGVHEGE